MPTRPLVADGMRTWESVTGRLRDLGILSSVDAEVITRYCETLELWTLAVAEVKRDGFTSPGRQGSMAASPASRILDTLQGRLAQAESALGLTPAARARLGIMTEATTSAADDAAAAAAFRAGGDTWTNYLKSGRAI